MERTTVETSKIISRKTRVKNELGMHARPASKIAQIAETAQSDVWIIANSTRVDATSIIDILTLCAVKDTKVVVEIQGCEDQVILEQIVDFFEIGFGEM